MTEDARETIHGSTPEEWRQLAKEIINALPFREGIDTPHEYAEQIVAMAGYALTMACCVEHAAENIRKGALKLQWVAH